MISLDGATERQLNVANVEQAQALVVEAGWNQVPADWELMLRLGCGFGIDDAAGALIATALTMPLSGRISWISMVLVAGRARRSGLGSHLLERCLSDLESRRRIACLDASELGRPLYLTLGFRDLYRLDRIVLEGRDFPMPATPPGVVLEPLAAGEGMAEVIAWDRVSSGFERGEILRDLQRRRPHCAWVARRAGRVAGYVLARDGRLATQVGPVLAEDEETAALLTSTAARAAATPAFIDVPVAQTKFREWLRCRGAAVQRGFVRMVRGEEGPRERAERIFAVAGPELG